MTKIKLCGLTRTCDIETVNELLPEYIGFVFAKKSRRYVSPEKALELKQQLAPSIQAVGVFVNEAPEVVADLLTRGIIDIAQLHGKEDETYIARLRTLTDAPCIKAFRIDTEEDLIAAFHSSADYILLDSGEGGTGTTFNWDILQAKTEQEKNSGKSIRPFFLAGGLSPENVASAVAAIHPYAVDVSSKIETDGVKDKQKMTIFVDEVRRVL